MCVVCALLLWLSDICLSPVICKSSLCLLWAGFGPCVVSGTVYGRLGLALSQIRNLPEMRLQQIAGCLLHGVP